MLCHHDAVSMIIGNFIPCISLSKNNAKICHIMWSTCITGLSKYSPSCAATVFHTTKDPGNHG